MKLTLVERLILVNQYTILGHLNPVDKEHYSRIRTAIEQGYRSEYKQALLCIDGDEMHEGDTEFVQNVLGMHISMAWAYEDASDRSEFRFGKPKFSGFDGNNESKFLGYATYLITQPGHYDSLKSERGYNSHCPMIEKYAQMLARYQQSKNTEQLTVGDVNRIYDR